MGFNNWDIKWKIISWRTDYFENLTVTAISLGNLKKKKWAVHQFLRWMSPSLWWLSTIAILFSSAIFTYWNEILFLNAAFRLIISITDPYRHLHTKKKHQFHGEMKFRSKISARHRILLQSITEPFIYNYVLTAPFFPLLNRILQSRKVQSQKGIVNI